MIDSDNLNKKSDKKSRLLKIAIVLVIGFSTFLLYLWLKPKKPELEDPSNKIGNVNNRNDEIENGIHVRTGFVDAEGLMTVVNNCTNCHSAKLVLQNRMNRERWESTIKWMQETQNLWPLGANKDVIINYLVDNYPPVDKGRRERLANIEWYELNE